MQTSARIALSWEVGEAPVMPPSTTQNLEEWLRSIPLDALEALYCVGADSHSYHLLSSWLHAKRHRRLIFLDDPGHIGWFLKEAVSWLDDPQVELRRIPNGQEREQLAREFPYRHIEVVALPSRQLPKQLRFELLRHTLRSHALFADRLQGSMLWHQFARNIQQLPRSFFANRLKGSFLNVPAVVVGAGPSLERDIAFLRTLEKRALIIAGGSAISILAAHNIRPHFAIAIDPNPEEVSRVTPCGSVPLLYSTRLHPEALARWEGPLGYMRSGIGGILEVWFEEELGLEGEMIGPNLHPDSLTVTPVAVAWAEYLGVSSVYLSGVDLAYTGGRRYAKGGAGSESREETTLKRLGVEGKKVETALHWVMESKSLASFRHRISLINASYGLKIPHVSHRPLSSHPFQEEWDLRGQIEQMIQMHAFPKELSSQIDEKLKRFDESLYQIVQHLEVLATESSEGKRALAEVELREEYAFAPLFYELEAMLPQLLCVTGRSSRDRWALMYEIACKYVRDTARDSRIGFLACRQLLIDDTP